MEGSILARRDCLTLDNGMRLRLLSALEVLQAQGLCKSYKNKQVLHNLDLTIQPGTIYGLIGRNGAGKTTLFNCLNRDIRTDGGQFYLETEEGSPIFSGGEAVLAGLRVGEIAALAKIWSQFNREENPALTMGQEEAEALKKN